MDLFELRNNRAFPSIHALLIEPFKTMWDNDDSREKEVCIKKFTYIELMCSPKKSNVFFEYAEDIRVNKVSKEVYGDENYRIDQDVMMATMRYTELLNDASFGYEMLTSGLTAAHRLKAFLREFKPDEKNNSGGLMLKPKELAAAISELPNVIKGIEEARNKVHEELEQQTKTRKNRQIGRYER